MFKNWGDYYMLGRGCSSSRVQIKDLGLTKGVDDKTSPF